MAEPPVCNASPLIYLSRAERLSILTAAGPLIVVPQVVVEELEVKGKHDLLTIESVHGAAFLRVEQTPKIPRPIERWDLGRGEAAVLAWAHAHPGAVAILDDLLARRCAASIGVPLVGTLGLVLRAKRLGLVEKARPVVEELIRCGMYLSPRVLDEALSLVGE